RLQTRYTGGTVFHIYLGESNPSWESVSVLIRRVAEKTELPYYTITPTFSVCPIHGYICGEHFSCPQCGKKCEVYSRVVGYLRPVSQWNDGKQSEFKIRKMFDGRVSLGD
ncbi:ribonucleoside triphosphate reductase, partial [Candidatus Bathyarchaeota archaeon]|nr:ribonucleoside triphosphate reductase [Candidatus Bathyarchaeota archaeon]